MRLSAPGPFPVHPVTIPELARRVGCDRKTVWRDLMRLHGADKARGVDHGLWMYRDQLGPWRVNLERLRAEHPERFGVPTREELQTSVVGVWEYARATRREMTRRLNAQAAALRAHRQEHNAARK